MDLGTPEALGDDSPTRRGWLFVLIAAVLVALAVVAAQAEARWHAQAKSDALAARADVNATADAAEAEVRGLVSYAGIYLNSSAGGADLRRELRGMVAREALRGADDVEQIPQQAPWTAWWHGDVAAEWDQVRRESAQRATELRSRAAQFAPDSPDSPA